MVASSADSHTLCCNPQKKKTLQREEVGDRPLFYPSKPWRNRNRWPQPGRGRELGPLSPLSRHGRPPHQARTDADLFQGAKVHGMKNVLRVVGMLLQGYWLLECICLRNRRQTHGQSHHCCASPHGHPQRTQRCPASPCGHPQGSQHCPAGPCWHPQRTSLRCQLSSQDRSQHSREDGVGSSSSVSSLILAPQGHSAASCVLVWVLFSACTQGPVLS